MKQSVRLSLANDNSVMSKVTDSYSRGTVT